MAVRPILAVATLVLAPGSLGLTRVVPAQTTDPVVRIFHPSAPLPAYDVATIKPIEPGHLSPNGIWIRGNTVDELIRNAYAFGAGRLTPLQVVGGPAWVNKDEFQVEGKSSPDLELALQKMNYADRTQQDHIMQQSLLADRFHLKVHFEIRELPVYALMPAKGGLKIKQAAPPSSPPSLPPLEMVAGRTLSLKAHSITMTRFIQALSINLNQTGDRPVLDQTGFTGYFDIPEIKWASVESADAAGASDAPSLATALEQNLGIKLVGAKGPVEVVVIDSIDHPSEN